MFSGNVILILAFWVVLLLCGGLCYSMAERKGLSPRIWIIAGIFLGPLALLVLLAVRPNRNGPKVPVNRQAFDADKE